MNDHDQDLRTLLRTYVEARREALDGHPSSEELQDFQEGKLSAAETERIRAHLPLCPDCTDFVLALSKLQDAETGASDKVPSEEVATAWSALREEIDRESPVPQPWQRGQILRLAAVLALAVIGLSLWCWQLYRENRRRGAEVADLATELKREKGHSAGLSADSLEQRRRIAELDQELAAALRPRINTPVVDLAPRSFRGAEPETSVPEIPAGSDLFTLVLEPEDRRTFPMYEAEIVSLRGRVLWKLERLEKTEFGNFTLTLFRTGLPPGSLTISVFGQRNSKRTKIGSYELNIPSS